MNMNKITDLLKTSGYFAIVAAAIVTLVDYYETKTGKSVLDLIKKGDKDGQDSN